MRCHRGCATAISTTPTLASCNFRAVAAASCRPTALNKPRSFALLFALGGGEVVEDLVTSLTIATFGLNFFE